ncbi:putative rIIA protein [Vibrio phage 496E54-1]|nr:putative rIIA protein [Vibrio phage 495E54-1]CAH9014283.1 putative rIIA protein [Vibrio phage 496E54-1]
MAIPINPETEVITGKSSRSEETGIEFNASMVKTLTSNLYDHKIEAVIREYSTNITDSHFYAGKQGVKGYVKLPTKFDPTAEFRDTGLGMDEDTIYNIFTVLGKSTKRGDNDSSGSLGLGSKSYLTVADQMTVTSVKDGVKTVVLCYKNRKGSLSADTKHVSKTDEPNGTVISIPVDLGKVNQWLATAARVLGAFRVPHEVNSFGDYQEEYDQMVEMCREIRESGGKFYRECNHVRYNMRSRAFALMGDVMYELPEYESLLPSTSVTHIAKDMLDSGFYCASFNIGDLDHAPSREAISYDDETFLKVKHRVRKDFVKEVKSFNDMIGGKDMTFYKFWHKFQGTAVYEALREVRLPFLKGNNMRNLMAGRYGTKAMFLDDQSKYGNIKGLVLSSNGEVTVYSSNVDTFYQNQLLAISTPLIMYSENEKGTYKIKQTLENAQKTHTGSVLLCENKQFAENLLTFFGVGKIEVSDQYSPEKLKRKAAGNRIGVSHGIKEDWETVGQVREITENGYSSHYGKVDLSKEGVYFLDDKDNHMKVKGIVKGQVNYLNMSTRISQILGKYGVRKIVLVNLNNKGKISRSGIENIDKVWTRIIKENKTDIIKATVWEGESRFSGYTKLLVQGLADYRKLVSREPNTNSLGYELSKVSDFHLNKTKGFEQEQNRKYALKTRITEKVEMTKKKLPLWSAVSSQGEEAVRYYLKLEKVIK